MAAAIPTEPENKADECFGKKCFNCLISQIMWQFSEANMNQKAKGTSFSKVRGCCW